MNILLDSEENRSETESNLSQLFELARLPKDTGTKIFAGNLNDILRSGKRSDLNITYIYPENINMAKLREKSIVTEASFLYTMDSGNENALA